MCWAAGAHDDVDGWVIVEEHLAAAAAWRQDAAAAIAHGDDLSEFANAVRDRSTDNDELSARPAGEVVDVISPPLGMMCCGSVWPISTPQTTGALRLYSSIAFSTVSRWASM